MNDPCDVLYETNVTMRCQWVVERIERFNVSGYASSSKSSLPSVFLKVLTGYATQSGIDYRSVLCTRYGTRGFWPCIGVGASLWKSRKKSGHVLIENRYLLVSSLPGDVP